MGEAYSLTNPAASVAGRASRWATGGFSAWYTLFMDAPTRDELVSLARDREGLTVTDCLTCRLPTLYVMYTQSRAMKPTPLTCGRLACMVAQGQMT